MRTLTNLLAIGLLSFTALHAQESNMSSTVKASEMYADGFSKFRFGGYGENFNGIYHNDLIVHAIAFSQEHMQPGNSIHIALR